jgi:hypothetical protein
MGDSVQGERMLGWVRKDGRYMDGAYAESSEKD